jgi:Spinocerebellar ataxia type 10 protein domain
MIHRARLTGTKAFLSRLQNNKKNLGHRHSLSIAPMNNNDDPSWSQKICQEYRDCSVPDERVHLLRRYARSIRDEMRNTNDCRVARTFVAFRRHSRRGRSGDEDDTDNDNDNDDHIHQLQQIAYDEWHEVLLQMATKDSFRVLCNCITQNINTAQRLLQRVPLEPTREQIRLVAHTNLLFNTLPRHDPSSTSTMMMEDDDCDAPQEQNSTGTWNWVDLIVTAARRSPDHQRATLAAVVACWYNATFLLLPSLHHQNNNMENDNNEDNDDIDEPPPQRRNKSSSSSPLFLATLLRHAIPMMTQLLSPPSSPPPDEATDWIRRAVVLYSRMYGGGLRASYTSLAAVLTVVPEQIVYLLLLRKSVESETSSPQKQQILEPLLGSTPAEMGTNLQFLVQLVMMRSSFTNNNNDNDNDQYDDHDDEMTTATTSALQRDVHHLALELLNETLTDDTGDRRIVVGTMDGFLDYIISALAIILDDWHARGQGKRSRDAPIMTDDQQRFLINAVRLLGNLTYQCPQNQNALRSSSVRITTPKHSNNGVDDDDRNGLHILLSTTGLAMSCFSVREWGIVAIRNALENNPANQAVVERLQAERAVQTTALDDMGLQINISKDGKATVTPKTEQQQR